MTISRSPSTILVFLSLTLSTTVVICGYFFLRAFTKLFFEGKIGEPITITTMISSVKNPLLTSTWRKSPYPVSSSYVLILKRFQHIPNCTDDFLTDLILDHALFYRNNLMCFSLRRSTDNIYLFLSLSNTA